MGGFISSAVERISTEDATRNSEFELLNLHGDTDQRFNIRTGGG